MKKLFLILNGLSFVVIGSISPDFINATNNVTNLMSTEAVSKQISIINKKVDKYVEGIGLRTDPINLTALGIKNNQDLNEYNSIELPEFKVNFCDGTKITDSGKKWGAQMSDGKGEYALIESFQVRFQGHTYQSDISRRHSLWYENDNYNLVLIYKFDCFYLSGTTRPHGRVIAELGSIVKFY